MGFTSRYREGSRIPEVNGHKFIVRIVQTVFGVTSPELAVSVPTPTRRKDMRKSPMKC